MALLTLRIQGVAAQSSMSGVGWCRVQGAVGKMRTPA